MPSYHGSQRSLTWLTEATLRVPVNGAGSQHGQWRVAHAALVAACARRPRGCEAALLTGAALGVPLARAGESDERAGRTQRAPAAGEAVAWRVEVGRAPPAARVAPGRAAFPRLLARRAVTTREAAIPGPAEVGPCRAASALHVPRARARARLAPPGGARAAVEAGQPVRAGEGAPGAGSADGVRGGVARRGADGARGTGAAGQALGGRLAEEGPVRARQAHRVPAGRALPRLPLGSLTLSARAARGVLPSQGVQSCGARFARGVTCPRAGRRLTTARGARGAGPTKRLTPRGVRPCLTLLAPRVVPRRAPLPLVLARRTALARDTRLPASRRKSSGPTRRAHRVVSRGAVPLGGRPNRAPAATSAPASFPRREGTLCACPARGVAGGRAWRRRFKAGRTHGACAANGGAGFPRQEETRGAEVGSVVPL